MRHRTRMYAVQGNKGSTAGGIDRPRPPHPPGLVLSLDPNARERGL
jgi:hypothetical protein